MPNTSDPAPQVPSRPPGSRHMGLWVTRLAFVGLLAAAWWLGRPQDDGGVRGGPPPPFAFEEVAQEIGLGFRHRSAALDPKVQHIQPHILGTGAAVSAVDFDRDGWIDLYVTSSDFDAPNALFRNLGDGSFQDVAQEAGAAHLNVRGRGVSMGSIWGDVDNSGYEDLLVHRYGYLALLRNLGDGTFSEVTAEAGLERWMYSNAATWIDYDRDGFLDLFVAGYFRAEHDLWNLDTTAIMHDSGEFSTNGGDNAFFRNRGDGTFEDVTFEVGLTSDRWTMAVSIADLDRDGWPDLYLANDYNSEQLFRNVEGRYFEEIDVGLGHDSKSGMSVSFGNVRNDGRLSVFVTNISKRGYVFHGNNLRLSMIPEGGAMVQTARGALVDTGWAWGARFADLDNDGRDDLFVVNGWISADERRDYWHRAANLAGGSGRILADAAHWPAFEGRSQSGYERSAVLHNRGAGSFVNVAEQVGVRDRFDGRSLVIGDFRRVGAQDVVIANQNGPLLYYRNTPAAQHSWIALEFDATRSNASAIGTEATLIFGDQRSLRIVEGGGGFASQNPRELFWGLGERSDPVRALVRWPSGVEQELEGLELNRRHRVREPESGAPPH